MKRSMRIVTIVLLFLNISIVGSAVPLMGSCTAATPLQNPTTRIYVDPLNETAAVGANYEISVKVDDVADLFGFEIQLRWGPAVLKYVSHTVTVPEDDYPGVGVLHGIVLTPVDEVNETHGVPDAIPGTTYALSCGTLIGDPFEGSGTMFTMTFEVLSEGECDIYFTATELVSKGPPAEPIPHDVEDGYFYWAGLAKVPVANFTFSPYPAIANKTVAFDASDSYDLDGNVGQYLWNFGDGTLDTTVTPTTDHTYTVLPGEITPTNPFIVNTVILTVLDDQGGGSQSKPVFDEVKIVHPRPVAMFTYWPDVAVVDKPVSFNASASYDPDPGGSVTKYIWDFGDGTDETTTNPIITHSYSDVGAYIPKLWVEDSEEPPRISYEYKKEKSIEVVEARGVEVTSVEVSPKTVTPGLDVTIDAIVANKGGSDEDFNVTAYYNSTVIDGDGSPAAEWTEIDEPTEVLALEKQFTPTCYLTRSSIGDTSWQLKENPEFIPNTNTKVRVGSAEGYWTINPGLLNTESASTTRVAGTPLTTGGWVWKENPINGIFTEGDWAFNVTVRATEAGVTAIIWVRILRSTDSNPKADGAEVTVLKDWTALFTEELATAMTQLGGKVTVPIATFNDEYLYVEYQLQVTANSGGDTTDVEFQVDGTSTRECALVKPTAFSPKESLTFNWDTQGVPPGQYWIMVNASEVPHENNLADNIKLSSDPVTVLGPDIAITDVVASPSAVKPGDSVGIDVSLENQGPEEETFDVTVRYDDTDIAAHYDVTLATGATTTEHFTWDTTVVADGTYTISAEVPPVPGETDKTDNTFTDGDVTVTTPAGYPVANFTYSPEEPIVDEEMTFNATASEDPDGIIANYTWDFGDETPPVTETDPIIKHTYTNAGDYTVTLTVADDENQKRSTAKLITVYAPPVANFTYSPSKPVVDKTVTFDATASYDPDGGNETYPSGIVSYDWDFDDGTKGTGNITTNTYTEFREYNVTLTVTDDEDLTSSTWQLITVYAPPVANFTYSPEEPIVDEEMTFNATASEDPDGIIANYTWDFGDETPPVTETDPIIKHTYTDTGTYTVTLNVTDDDGVIGNATAEVIVSAPSSVHDVAVTSVVPSSTSVTRGQSVNVSVDVKNKGGFPETFNVTAYHDSNPIGIETVTLDPGATRRLNLTWYTTTVAQGTYTISANASEVPGETDIEDNTFEDGEVTVLSVGPQPGPALSIEFSGEREYFEDEDVKIKLVALVMYVGGPASNANVTIRIFDPDGELWVSGVMVERLTGTGIYEWESTDTILELELEKGFYLIHVQARLGGLEASEISQFHIIATKKIASIISIDANPTSVTAGSSITLSGAITPKRLGVTVTILSRRRAGNWSELTTVKTSSTGHYSLGWVETNPGTYEVKASWAGDTGTEGSESEVKTVTVYGSGLSLLEIPPYAIVGIAAIIGSIVGSIVGSLVRIRIRKQSRRRSLEVKS